MTPCSPTLGDRLATLIAREGPISVARYMEICLHDPLQGYYASRPNLGEAGDFITAPLVSQMFGELLGLWAAEVWARLGRPVRVLLVEMGPGHGVMMADMLRALEVAPGAGPAIEPWLIETSAPLRARQARTLADLLRPGRAAPRWAGRLADLPAGAPVILLANEVLDCLPIRQAVRGPDGWRERRVGLGAPGALAFVPGRAETCPAGLAEGAPGSVAEWSTSLVDLGREVGALLARAGGAGLFIDYGRAESGLGDTLQALRGHRKVDPLAHPGETDLTAHVDFPAFIAAARDAGAWAGPIRGQGAFLTDLGIRTRAGALAAARPDRADAIGRQLNRLIAPDQMGVLFKCAALASPGLRLPAFETSP
jgi:SAM-dependent MidA family methyltransferase